MTIFTPDHTQHAGRGFLDPAFSLVSRAALKSWVWSSVRDEINFTLSDTGLVSFEEIECMDTNEKRDSVIVNLTARESLGVIESPPDPY